MFRIVLLSVCLLIGALAPQGRANPVVGSFDAIEGGVIDLRALRGQAVLVVNTASHCGFTQQYAGLQALYDRYRDRGLVVLAVPSDDFNQELDSAAEVKRFCEVTFGLDLPMTDITPVRGEAAHPFYAAVRAETGFEPKWNFNKVLIGPEGRILGTWRARTKPLSAPMIRAVEAALP